MSFKGPTQLKRFYDSMMDTGILGNTFYRKGGSFYGHTYYGTGGQLGGEDAVFKLYWICSRGDTLGGVKIVAGMHLGGEDTG